MQPELEILFYFEKKSDSQFHLCVELEAKWEPKVFHKN
jgi:hypothetical protein